MLFSQQQCFIYSTASFFVEIEGKEGHKTVSTNDGLPKISKVIYRIPEPGTTISSFADSKKKKKINTDRPTLDIFFYMGP